MIDSHSHLLPGLDHGCPDLETSMAMARAASASGVSTVVCTPHLPDWDVDFVREARSVCEQVRQALDAEGIELRLLMGFEVDLTVAASEPLERLAEVSVEGAGQTIVLETPYTGWPVFMDQTIFRLSTAGLVPVLAHPERNDQVQRSSETLLRCLKAGAVAQATAGSVGGIFGKAPIRALRRLLSEGLIGLVASDAHAFEPGGWTVAPLLDTFADRLSDEDIAALTQSNPELVLAGRVPSQSDRPAGQSSWLKGRRTRPR